MIMKVPRLWCVLVASLVFLAPLLVRGQVPVEEEEATETEEEEEGVVVEEDTEEEVMAEETEENLEVASGGLPGQDETLLFDKYGDVEEPGDHCSRYSPKEVFHTHVHPHLLKTLDEMSHFVESVLSRMEWSLLTLLPHVDHSPVGDLKVEELFPEVRRFMQGTLRDVYDVIRTAWWDLIRIHVRGDVSPARTLAAVSFVREAQERGEARLVAALQELTVTLKAVILNSVLVVRESLKLPNGTKEQEAAQAIDRNLPKVAPNFLGTLMSLILRRGSDPSGYKKIRTDPLRTINPLVEEMYRSLEELVTRGGGSEEELSDYWRNAVSAAHQHLEESPLLEEDYEIIFRNEEYLAELVLELMASF
ncbi:uncharacterized protein [Panulirus ornatus]|uniref:uncharacterized protein isoform X1 n=1 Tax=Panulirus ornatus TaxID=150431 RepID=UPI003A851569